MGTRQGKADQREARGTASPSTEMQEPNQNTDPGHRTPRQAGLLVRDKLEHRSPEPWAEWGGKGREGAHLGFLLLRLSAISLTAWGWDMTRLNPYCTKGKRQRKGDLNGGEGRS